MYAAKLAGLTTIPAIIREMTDEEAVIIMVDANIQREELLPSERAFAFKMKMDAIKHQGIAFGHKVQKWSHEEIGTESGFSGRQVNRYIRLTELVPELLDMVDQKKLNLTLAVDISYIDKEIQKWIYEYIHDNGFIKPNQIAALRKQLETGNVSQSFMISIFNNAIVPKKQNRKITLSEKSLTKYFPPQYSREQVEDIIVTLLEKWKKEQEA